MSLILSITIRNIEVRKMRGSLRGTCYFSWEK